MAGGFSSGFSSGFDIADAGGTPGSVTPAAITLSAALNAATVAGGAVVQAGEQLALVLPQSIPASSAVATPGATSRSFTLPVLTVEGGTVVETGISASVTLPAPGIQSGSVLALDSIDMAAVASQVTIIIGATEYDQWVWVDNIW